MEVKKRDLRAELLAAEAYARNKKRKAEGKAPLVEDAPQDEEANKRRKLLEDIEQDKDEDEEVGKVDAKDDDADDRCVFCIVHCYLKAHLVSVTMIPTTTRMRRPSC